MKEGDSDEEEKESKREVLTDTLSSEDDSDEFEDPEFKRKYEELLEQREALLKERERKLEKRENARSSTFYSRGAAAGHLLDHRSSNVANLTDVLLEV